MQQNHQETQQRMLEMQHQITGLHSRLDGLSVEMRARDVNNHARLANNTLVRKADQPPEPLCSITTGDPIQGFPATLDDVLRLDLHDGNQILEHLGQNIGLGTLANKRLKLKALSGLVAFQSSFR